MAITRKGKEMEERLSHLEGVNAQYEKLVKDVCSVKTLAEGNFAVAVAEDAKIGQKVSDLTKIIHKQREHNEKVSKEISDISTPMEELCNRYDTQVENEKQLEKSVKEAKEIVGFVAELKQLCEKYYQSEEDSSKEWEKTFGQSLKQMSVIQEEAKRMSVLSLNSAVEASRLGEIGRGFLQAADEVRKMSDNYSKLIEEFSESIKLIKSLHEGEREARKQIFKSMEHQIMLATNMKQQNDDDNYEFQKENLSDEWKKQKDMMAELIKNAKENDKILEHCLGQLEQMSAEQESKKSSLDELENSIQELEI